MKHVFILNPAAGKSDHTQQYRQTIEEVCRGLDYEILVSEAPGCCKTLAAEAAAAASDEMRIYACGGDGTLNEVVNGVYGYPNVAVTHFPGGSGNDAVKIFDDPKAFNDLTRLLDPEETRFDVIRCNGVCCLDILSVGFDARVGYDVSNFKRLPMISGKGAYILSLVRNLTKPLSQHFVVTLETGEVIDANQTMICVCNGRWYGGGFNPVPEAEPDDGLLDVLLVSKVGLLKAVSAIKLYQSGQYYKEPKLIRHEQCRSIRIQTDVVTPVNIDGEAIHTDDAHITLEPGAIRFFYPKGLTYRAKN